MHVIHMYVTYLSWLITCIEFGACYMQVSMMCAVCMFQVACQLGTLFCDFGFNYVLGVLNFVICTQNGTGSTMLYYHNVCTQVNVSGYQILHILGQSTKISKKLIPTKNSDLKVCVIYYVFSYWGYGKQSPQGICDILCIQLLGTL